MLFSPPKKNNQNGFTLIELLVVIAIVGTLVGVIGQANLPPRVQKAVCMATGSC